MPLDVDATPPRASGQLGEFAGGDLGVGLAVVLDQLLDHHGLGRHVDAQRQRLGGEDDFDQAVDEPLLHDRLERRQQARVVGRDTPAERFDEGLPLQCLPVRPIEPACVPLGDLQQPLSLDRSRKPQV